MPQKTNLNISPYYDDFNADDNFYKVLFRPGRPVQARELTTLQSILQNQVESFGDHMFKEGTMVIPGSVAYDSQYFSVKIESEHLGLPVSLYLYELKGKKFKGQNSGVEFIVNDCKVPEDSTDITHVTLFIKYLTGSNDNLEAFISDSEPLIAQETIVYGNTTITVGDSVANAIDTDAAATGSAVKIETGVYFIRGSFVTVTADTIILDPYSNQPSYRVGLSILETIVTAKEDSELYDNARGFSNYAAPGADRLKITTELSKKSLTDFNDTNFIEIVKLRDGNLKKLQDTTVYSEIAKEFARRTFEESGNYSLGNFNVKVSNSLDDGIGNEGIFKSNQVTDQNNTPTDDLACVEVDPGKAYVHGFRINSVGTTIIDIDKPREKEVVDTAKVAFELGSLIRVDNVTGTPKIKLDETSNTVQLLSKPKLTANGGVGQPSWLTSGIGTARVYSVGLRNTPYVDNDSEWNLYLYDVQTYTALTLNESLSAAQCPNGSFIRGVSSDATGYMADISGSIVSLVQTSGTFIRGEAVLINETNLVPRSIVTVTQYGSQDIKSVFQKASVSGNTVDFSANTVLKDTLVTPTTPLNTQFTIVDGSGGGSTGTITGPGITFDGVKAGDLVKYAVKGVANVVINEVESVDPDLKTLNVVSVAATTGIANLVNGFAAPAGFTTTSAMVRIIPEGIVNNDEKGLYTPLERRNISDVNFSGSELLVSSQLSGTTDANGSVTISLPTGISSGFYSSFDTQKYSVIYDSISGGGGPENLTKDQFALTNGATQVTLSGLRGSQAVKINATVEKATIKEKIKEYSRSKQIQITHTQTGINTTTSGLTQNNFYGLRVEDKEISLNVCDVANVVAVLESKDTSAPTLDKLTTVSGLSLDINSVVGERITGTESAAVAQLVTRTGSNNVEIVYLNTNKFNIGEVINFDESNITTTLQAITPGNNINITDRYSLDKGQREQYYDYSRIVRKAGTAKPSKRLLVVYNSYIVPADDTGDVFTVESYDESRFSDDVPLLGNNVRASDTLDFRPRVSEFNSTTASPFAYSSRDFGTAGNASTLVISPEGDSNLGYSFYLPRIDKLILSLGEDNIPEFSVLKGVSSLQPKAPAMVETGMEVATIALPAYLYSPSNARITLVDNKRYTMRDIGKLDKRITNLEIVTSLTMLELDTKSLQIMDEVGDRFKSGFFVDNFKDISRMDVQNPDNKVDVDIVNGELIVPLDRYTFKPELGLSPSINSDTADYTQNLTLLDTNVRKTGDLITLDYSETDWIENAFASKVENINPFEVVAFDGTIALDPVSDNWTRTVVVDGGKRTVVDGNTLADPSAEFQRILDNQLSEVISVVQTDNEITTTTLEFDSEYIETILTGTVPETHIRSRNVGFKAHALKPGIQYYPFFDGRSGIDIIPKLIEISMTSGTFSVAEDVKGYIGGDSTNPVITFRTANADHREGTYNDSTSTGYTPYIANPYDLGSSLSSVYTSSSTVLNVDIGSLTEEAIGKYFGRLEVGMKLVGSSSNAEATVTNIRLIGDDIGNVYGSFFIRNPLTSPAPPLRFTNGTKTFRLSSSVSNETPLPGNEASVSSGEGEYTTAGTLETFRQTNVVVGRTTRTVQYMDPLAQSFRCDESGAFLSSVDVYFGTKDDSQPVTVQLRTMELGTPTDILAADYAEVIVPSSDITVSNDASIATNIKFPSPIYLNAGTEYALVLLSPGTTKYTVWISRIGDITIETRDLGEGNRRKVGTQYIGGSLFKSQNGTIWTPTQEEDLKFTLYKCAFKTGTIGDLTLYNPKLQTSNVNFGLSSNAITSYPRKLTVGIDYTSVLEAELVPGIKVSASTNDGVAMNVPDDPTGFIESVGGPIEATTVVNQTIGITTVGLGTGYEPSQTYSGVNLQTITGNGSGATATVITNVSGGVANVSIASSGSGYAVGDVLGITTADLGNDKKGTDAQVTVADRAGIDKLYLTNVQGENFTTNKLLIWYSDPANGTIHQPGAASTAITSSALTSDLYSGNIVQVNNYNHGMTSDNNKVTLTGIQPDGIPTTLSANFSNTDTVISVANTSVFGTFEGISTSTGYAQVGQEIIYYNGIGAGTLNVGTRGFSDTSVSSHSSGDSIFKYEYNGISLTGINTTHSMATAAGVKALKTIDSYFVAVPRGSGRPNLTDRSVGVNQLSFTEEMFAGGSFANGTQNFQYDSFMPAFSVMTPGSSTILEAKLRSVTGTSDGGNESSFNDVGYEPVVFNKLNRLSSPRLLASGVDETTYLTNLPKNRSVTLLASFSTSDANLSPVLDTMNGAFRLYRNRLNNPISDYARDSRSNALVGDPHAACYISQVVNLTNESTSLKVLISAFRPASSDFRVLYRLIKPDSTGVDEAFKLFPGYDNLKDVGIDKQVIDSSLNSGRPDVLVPPSTSNQFLDYEFTTNNEDGFTGFQVKIVISGTNESTPPRFKDLRVIALA